MSAEKTHYRHTAGLLLFTIPDLVDFYLEGAEILKVENHKREALL